MEQDKTDLEKILDVYSAAKQIKYLYDDKNKLMPVDRIGKIGKGVCYDHCRYQAYLAKNYGLESRCYVFISVDSTGNYAYTGHGSLPILSGNRTSWVNGEPYT
jgi:hypothetical protein